VNAIARFYIDLAIALGLIASCRVLNRHGWGCLDGHDHAWRT
jgi:hypothetical protein